MKTFKIDFYRHPDSARPTRCFITTTSTAAAREIMRRSYPGCRVQRVTNVTRKVS